MAVLDDVNDIKTVLGITDTTKDALLTVYIRKGITLITAYMNAPAVPITVPPTLPVDVATAYEDALIEYVTLTYRKKGNEGIKQFSQGSRSGTYEDGLQQSVKDLLPSPFIRMVGVRNGNYVI
jgi:hypothetical protein